MSSYSPPLMILAAALAGAALAQGPKEKRAEQKAAGEESRGKIRADMEARYRRLDHKLDSLWSDSMRIRGSLRRQYRRTLLEARAVRDHTKVALDELGTQPGNAALEAWEPARARARQTLDSLENALSQPDSIHQGGGDNESTPRKRREHGKDGG